MDAFNRQVDTPRYARMVPFGEIERNDYNLNLPRYIDSQTPEDRQDIAGHLLGGIPQADIDALERYWTVCSTLRGSLFRKVRPGYLELTVNKAAIKSAIQDHPEFARFVQRMTDHFNVWRERSAATLKALESGFHPKDLIAELAEDLLAQYARMPLIDPYAVYQHLMDYWAETMQDDCYLIAADGWKAETYRVLEMDKKGRQRDKGWACDLIPKELIVARYFAADQAVIDELAGELEGVTASLAELEEEHGGEYGAFADLEKINKAHVSARLTEIMNDAESGDEVLLLRQWLTLNASQIELKSCLKATESMLDRMAYAQYANLTEAEVKALVVDDKWLAALHAVLDAELDRASQALTHRIRDLAERYDFPIPQLTCRLGQLETRVRGHLQRMGFAWQ